MDRLAEFWSALDGPVHPEDRRYFGINPDVGSLFQRGFIPSPFFGDVANAPVILCFGNGGSEDGQMFYRTPSLQDALMAHIRNPGPIDPRRFFDYFKDQWFTPLIANGAAALVNAVAYRSKNMNDLSLNNTKNIPSVVAARSWIRGACDAARGGRRLVVFHRWRLWGVSPHDAGRGIIFSSSPASKHLPMNVRAAITEHLDGHTDFRLSTG